ncbi:hypothetical protein COT99_03285 [Candidatus Falkowbacteria bacterium CG10_big_fil_rev_8_21_14_0_10_43_10]|uniref:Uncharacterized protein n=1 Tax=Candidatus Falkowbacteria bacterium CG10_big_fil_rev_8_21_14_0_10_43_10 TaxID=1974567 RepID=A0A2H0V1L4_9BACT|nr:MAG: hypothetical protein COT99_03285 [Candidatus Falkowbacteria bacterium CG10_big_fil_rev_8_21_14_0_10_43_10]
MFPSTGVLVGEGGIFVGAGVGVFAGVGVEASGKELIIVILAVTTFIFSPSSYRPQTVTHSFFSAA